MMNNAFTKLFKPGRIGKMEVENRIVKAPTYTLLAAHDGSVSERLIRHYQELANGGSGLIIVEFAYVDHKASQSGACQLCVADNTYIPGLSLLAQAIQAKCTRAALQISHCGSQRRLRTPPIKAPSRIPSEDAELRGAFVPEELTVEEIQEIITAFGDAALRAKVAGFDMVEVHGAHGYLPTAFLSPHTNKRTDWYGGSPENRMRFLLQISRDIREKVGPEFPFGIRLSGVDYEPDGIMIEDTIQLVRELEKLGVDIVHISCGNYRRRLPRHATMALPLGPMVWMAEEVKKEVSIPVIASGSINTPELAEEILEKGKADFVSLARQLLADPHWPQKAKEGRVNDIVPCIRCNEGCYYRSQVPIKAILCTVNPALGKEEDLRIQPAPFSKKVAVLGGGPAGMEAARVCALRGYEVTLYEKRQLGGALIEASAPEFKPDLRKLLTYYTAQIDKLKVKVIYEEATAETIRAGGFDTVIVATGGIPIQLEIPGADKPMVVGALDVLSGKVPVGQRVLVIGGGMVGTETGLFLAEQGKEVTFVELLDEFMNGIGYLDQIVYKERLGKQKVTVHTGKRVESIVDNGALVVDRYGNRENIPADSIVVAIGFASNNTLLEQPGQTGIEMRAVGDCLNPRKLFEAIHEGFLAALSIR